MSVYKFLSDVATFEMESGLDPGAPSWGVLMQLERHTVWTCACMAHARAAHTKISFDLQICSTLQYILVFGIRYALFSQMH